MGTPSAAIPRDIEQELRTIRRQLRTLTSLALNRKRFSVTDGDFVVRGGQIVSQYGDGTPAFDVGQQLTLADDGMESCDLVLYGNDAGTTIAFQVRRIKPGTVYPAGYASLDFAGNDVNLTGADGMTLRGYDHGASDYNITISSGGTFVHGPFALPSIGTTGAGANLNWDSSLGAVRVVTSSERFKDVIGDAEVDEAAVLALQEVIYTRKDDAAADPERFVGFIAERAHDLGLTQWVVYDEDGLPWSFDYVLFSAVAHQAVLRKHRAELDAQQQRMDALEQRLAALEA